MTAAEGVGSTGVALLLLAFALASFGRLDNRGATYHAMSLALFGEGIVKPVTHDAISLRTAAGPVEIALSPAELGHLRMSIVVEGDGLQIHLTADRAETLDLLRRHGDLLQEEMRAAGFTGASLSFGSSGGQAEQPSAGASPADAGADATSSAPLAAQVAQAMAGSGSLHLRL